MKGKLLKRIAAVTAVLTLSVSGPLTPFSGLSDMFAVTASAAETSGESGNCVWSLEGQTFTISAKEGTDGKMADYPDYDSPFYDHFNIRSIVLNEGVTYIGSNAFYNCRLTSVTLPGSLKEIGEGAFDNAFSGIGVGSGFYTIDFPEGLEKIGDNAFNDCNSLPSVSFPASLTYIGKGAFAGCTGMKEYKVADGNSCYSSEDGVLFNKEKTNLIAYPTLKTETAYTVPGTVTTITSFGENKYLTEITLPAGLQTICDSAFDSCTGITTIDLSSCTSLSSVGKGAFDGCYALRTIDLSGCTSLTDFDSYRAFAICQDLTTVSLPAGVTDFVFSDAFLLCDSLTAVNIAADNTAYSSVDGVVFNKAGDTLIYCPNGRTGIYTVPSSVDSIADGVFKNCSDDLKIVFETETPPELEGLDEGKYNHFSDSGTRCIYVPANAVDEYTGSWSYQDSYAPVLSFKGYYTVTLPDSMEIVSDDSEYKLADGKYLNGAAISFKAKDGYTIKSVYADQDTLTPDENGIYSFTISAKDVTVSAEVIGATNFADLQDLINDTDEGGTLTLDNDYTAVSSEGTLNIPAGKTITIDLNGHTIDRGLAGSDAVNDGYVIKVEGDLTLTDGSDEKTGTITGGNNSSYYCGGVFVKGTGTFTMNGGTISGNKTENSGGGVYVLGGGTFTMNDGAITGNTAELYGGGVCVLRSTFTMNGGTITGNSAEQYGGGVFVEYGAFIMNEGSISGNTTEQYGGGVYVYQTGIFYLRNGVTVSDVYGTVKHFGTVTTYETEHGTITANEGTLTVLDNKFYVVGDTVTLTVTPNVGYAVKSVTVNDTAIDAVNGVYSFTMPAEDVTVSAEFEKQKRAFTLPDHMEITNGVTLTDGKADYGTVISFKVSEGYTAANVKNGETVLIPDESGIYTVTVEGDTVITADIQKKLYELRAYGLRLNSDIGLDVYFSIDESVINDVTRMVITLPNRQIETVNAPFTKENNGYYRFSAKVAAKEMADKVRFELYTNDTAPVYTADVSVKDAAQQYLDSKTQTENTKALVRAMLNYGAYSQSYFRYRTDDPAITGEVLPTVDYTKIGTAFDNEKIKLPDDGSISFTGVNLALESNTSLVFTITNSSANTLTYELEGNTGRLDVKKEGNETKLIITDIPAENLADDFIVRIKVNGEGNYQVYYSPMTYARYCVKNNRAEKNVMLAFYEYCRCAKNYVKK